MAKVQSLIIFVSSKTAEFAAERKAIKKELEELDKSISVFIFEDDARPTSMKADVVYREQVSKCSIYVGLFKNEFSKATMEEYEVSLSLNKERLIYIDDSQKSTREKDLSEAIEKFHAKNTVKHSTDSGAIVQLVKSNLINLMVDRYHLSIPSISIPGLTFIYPNYFDYYTNHNMREWKKGFEFDLVSVKLNLEFKRQTILMEIVSRLNSQNVVLLIGEVGSSKTTLLYEVLCHFHAANFYVFRVDTVTPNGINDIVTNIEKLLLNQKKIFVACDNLLSSRRLPILEVIQRLTQYKDKQNVKFLLTARNPDFNKIVRNAPVEGSVIQSEYLSAILSLSQKDQSIYQIPSFSAAETADFLLKYRSEAHLKTPSQLLLEANGITEETKGNAFLVKCFTLQIDLSAHIRTILNDYLGSPETLTTMMICSLLRLSDIIIDNKKLEKLGIIRHAMSLEGVTLTKTSEQEWLTIHTRWDREFCDFLFKSEENYQRHIDLLESAIQKIFLLADEDIVFSIFMTLYDMIDRHLLRIEKIDSIGLPAFISDKKQSALLYGLGILHAHLEREDGFGKALEKFDLSIEKDPQNINPYNEKGNIFYYQFRFHDSLAMFRSAVDRDPANPIAYMNIVRPMLELNYPILQELGYAMKAIDLCKDQEKHRIFLFMAYNNTGTVFLNNEMPFVAETYYNLSSETRANYLALYHLGLIHFKYHKDIRKAFWYFSMAHNMEPGDPRILEFAIRSLRILGDDAKAEIYLEDMKKLMPDRYEAMKEFYSNPNWRNYQYPLTWRSVGDYPRRSWSLS